MQPVNQPPEKAEPLSWRIQWDFGHASVQALGAMLGPVEFRLDEARHLQVMHVAPWAGTSQARELPGVLRRLRGEWPCVPFGRTDAPTDLPLHWQVCSADDDWPHGYGANHEWHCEHADAGRIDLAIDYPGSAPVARLERRVQAVAGMAALDVELVVHPRRSVMLPVGLHPTFRLPEPAGRVQIELGAHEGIFAYPSRSTGGTSYLVPDQRSDSLSAVQGINGLLDLSRLPLPADAEELLQVRGVKSNAGDAPLRLHYLDHDATVALSWDTADFPDLMLWISNRGRRHYPWQSRHVALGAEPINGLFDLGRVARAPEGHPLANRLGIRLEPGRPWKTRYRIAASSTPPARPMNSSNRDFA
jgi:hypothetical protein